MNEEVPPVVVRPYRQPADAAGTHDVYRAAILTTAASDYEPEQLAAWAGAETIDLDRWNLRRAAAHTFVATIDGRIVGFADFCDDELLDMLFVHPGVGGRGIARLLVATVKDAATQVGLSSLHTHASRTAKAAFEHFGFRVVTGRPDNMVAGRTVPNYEMRCDLPT